MARKRWLPRAMLRERKARSRVIELTPFEREELQRQNALDRVLLVLMLFAMLATVVLIAFTPRQ
jgi:hypothetical protein